MDGDVVGSMDWDCGASGKVALGRDEFCGSGCCVISCLEMDDGLGVASVERPIELGPEAKDGGTPERAESTGENVSDGATDGDAVDEGSVSLPKY